MRVIRQPEGVRTPLGDGIVEDVVGPTEGGAGWAVAVRVGDALWVLPEDDLESSGPGGHVEAERIDTIQLRLVTELTEGIEAARVAKRIESVLHSAVGPAVIEIEAERHWAEPYFYELDVIIQPLDDALVALRALVGAGSGGWLTCRDDGWRCDLWWNAEDDEPGYLVREVRGAELTLLPWGSPSRRPETERPLVTV